jgi:hypothetical protein
MGEERAPEDRICVQELRNNSNNYVPEETEFWICKSPFNSGYITFHCLSKNLTTTIPPIIFTLKMETVYVSQASVPTYKTTHSHHNMNLHCHNNLESYMER